MKNTATILHQLLFSHASLQPLKRSIAYRSYIALLPPKWQRLIAFVYLKNRVLFIALKHPGFKDELSYQKATLLSLWNQHITTAHNLPQAQSLKIFHSRYHPLTPPQKGYDSKVHYQERSFGAWEVKVSDSEVKEKLESIRHIIQRHNDA